MKEYCITNDEAGQRLDKFLLKYMNKAGKGFIYKMLRKKNIKLNGAKAAGSELLKPGDAIQLFLSDETIAGFMSARPINNNAGAIEIIYEDDHILAVNKPEGVLSQPDSQAKDSVVDRILKYLYNKGEYDNSAFAAFTPAIVNRLDRNTTGIVLCGKTLAAVQELNSMIQGGCISKYYLSIVKGRIKESRHIENYHLKDMPSNTVSVHQEYVPGAKKAVTLFRPVSASDSATLLEIKLITGRTHQIRIHLSQEGHPVLGDPKYGDPILNQLMQEKCHVHSQLLHAWKIVFDRPSGNLAYLKDFELTANPPEKFNRAGHYFKLL